VQCRTSRVNRPLPGAIWYCEGLSGERGYTPGALVGERKPRPEVRQNGAPAALGWLGKCRDREMPHFDNEAGPTKFSPRAPSAANFLRQPRWRAACLTTPADACAARCASR
jgi:hypothetical protein